MNDDSFIIWLSIIQIDFSFLYDLFQSFSNDDKYLYLSPVIFAVINIATNVLQNENNELLQKKYIKS